MKRPLSTVALLYMGGILLGQWFHPPLIGLFTCSFISVLGAIFWKQQRLYLLGALLVLLGWTNLNSHTALISPNDLRVLTRNETTVATVRGILHASPTARIFERQGRELWHSSVVIDVDQIRFQQGWQPAFGKIIAYTPGILSSNFFNGQTVEINGVLAPLSGPRAEGLFDARSFYSHQNIYYQLRTESENAWSVPLENRSRAMPLSDRFSNWARNSLALGLGPEDTPLRLIWTLTLDWKAPLTEAVEEPFMRAGTFHIFAVDGLRIGLLAAIGIGLLRVLRLPRALCGFLIVPIIWFYVGLTGWPASAVRAAIMATIIIVGWAGRRPSDLVNSLFAAAFVILLWDPGQLFQPGFQFSFLVVLCIALILPLLRKLFQSWVFRTDPYLPEPLRPRWPVPLHRAVSFAIDTCAISLAAWLGSIPLAAYYFHLFTPISIPANIVVVPLTALTLTSAIASLLTVSWLPGMAALFNHASWFLMDCIIHFSQWAAHWQPGSYYVAPPPPVLFLLYYLALFLILTGWVFRSKYKWVVAALLVALASCWTTQRILENKIAHLHFLPLDGGAAVFVQNAGPDSLFDCGNAATAASVTKPFLGAHGVNSLDAFALTIGHVQDTGGAAVISTNFTVKRLYLNPARDRSSAYRQVIEEIKRTAPWQTVQARDNMQGWAALHPTAAAHFPNADDNALVFQREINGHSVLLLSGLGRTAQSSFIAAHPGLRAEIVATALPMTDEPVCGALLDLLQPKLVIIIDSAFPATRRASARLRARLGACGVPIIYCHDTGALKLNIRREGWTLENASGEPIVPLNLISR